MLTLQNFLSTEIILPIITSPTSGLYGDLIGITVTSFDIAVTLPTTVAMISLFVSNVPVPLC
jgi:hypothetical protein